MLSDPLKKDPVILLVVIGTLAHIGGAERQALYLVEHLASLPGCRVEVLTFEDGSALRPTLDALDVPIHVHPYYFRWSRGRRLRSLLRLAWLLRFRIKPDALLPFVGIHSKAMAQVWPFSGARFCWWNQQDEGRDLHGTREEGRILRRASCITSNSEAGRDFLSETYGLPRDSILVYNNGTPLPDLVAIQGRANDRNGRLSVCMIANITSFKDHETLFRAWPKVRDHFPADQRLVLRLAGHLRDQRTVHGLKVLAFELGLSSDEVKFLGPVEDVNSLILESDVVVHSSLTEGCPNAVCEAMAMGRAVVATDIPGCRQALGPEGIEWLAAPGDPAALADRIICMLESPELRRNTGVNNRRRVESEFSITGMNRFFHQCIDAGLNCRLGEEGIDEHDSPGTPAAEPVKQG